MTYTYANGVKMIVGQQQKDIPDGVTFIGEKGKIYVTRGKIDGRPARDCSRPKLRGRR